MLRCRHARAARRLDLKLHVARHILTEVDDALALGCDDKGNGRKTLLFGDVLTDLRDELAFHHGAYGFAKLLDGQRLIHGLAVIDLGKGDLVVIHIPALVGGNARPCAVCVKHVQPGDE